MRGYNHVTLVGNIAENPKGYKDIARNEKSSFTIAVNRSYKKNDEQEVDFIPVITWGKLATICNDYLEKGKRVLVDGRIHANQDTKQLSVVADEITILAPK